MMMMTRREMGFGLAALGALAGCGAPGGGTASRGPSMQAVPNPGWDAWVAAFQGRARAQGLSQPVIDEAFRGAGFLPGVVERDRNQTEFTRSLEDYLAIAASDERVSNGRSNYRRYGNLLSEIEGRYGVEGHVVTAIWGLESSYGDRRGDIPVVSALSTLAYDGRRGAFFEDQLIAALRILQNGDVAPSQMLGSWAGAMGHTQFIPTSYLAFAVDFRGDGQRDIWSNDPTDALASAARYLQRNGWTLGQPWGVEVTLPAGFSGPVGRGSTRAPAAWASAGVRAVDGSRVPDYGAASIIRPSGASGPSFMTFRNFTVITRYNNSESYVIGVGHLSDRIVGGAPIQGSFPPDRYGLTKTDRQDLQRGLSRAGFDAGDADGVIGSQTVAAIEGYQRANGLAVTGTPSRDLLTRVR